MPTLLPHPAVALGLAPAFWRPGMPARVWVLGIVAACLPDLDALGLGMGIRYEDLWGHRGLMHSIPFAAAVVAVMWAIKVEDLLFVPPLWSVALYLFFCAASHGLLDAMTDGSLGIALLSPLSTATIPWGYRGVLSPQFSEGSKPRADDDVYVYSKGPKGTGTYLRPFTPNTGRDGSVDYSSLYGSWHGR